MSSIDHFFGTHTILQCYTIVIAFYTILHRKTHTKIQSRFLKKEKSLPRDLMVMFKQTVYSQLI